MAKDDQQNRDILDEAKSDGATAIILTADSTVSGNRDRDVKNKFVYPFGMPIVQRYLRGSAEGMSLNNIYGASKQKSHQEILRKSPLILDYQYSLKVFNTQKMQIWQSKLVHQVSGYLTTELVNYMRLQVHLTPFQLQGSVNKRVPIVFDSGVRRGEHVAKALASVADVVALGRPVLFGLALGGWQGAYSVLTTSKKI